MTGSITFNGLKSDTSYDVVKRAADLAVTESRITEMRTKSTNPSPSLVPNPSSTPKVTPSAAPSVTTGGTSGTQTTGHAKENIAAGRSDDWKRHCGIKNSDNCYEENYGAEDEILHQAFESKRSKGKMQLQ